jgi:EAL domain-containing protein (putative c-di-GMP-specific phosphodiesterase class I)
VAEGIEHRATLEILADFGCDFGQGYHFCHPLPPDEFLAWTRAHTLDTVTAERAD